MSKVTEEGTPFTRRKRKLVSSEDDEFDGAMRRLIEHSRYPWGSYRRLAEEAKAALVAELEGKPDSHQFKSREDDGWYLQQIVVHGRAVERHIADSKAEWAAFEAARFGELLCELRLKVLRENTYLTGWAIGRAGAENLDQYNAVRQRDAEVESAELQRRAEAIWKRSPDMSKNAVARLLKQKFRLELAERTIAKKLTKGETGHR
jgi:hypothetical protein